MIRFSDVRKHYGARAVLNGVSLELTAGKITGLVGPNGCGKTTLIKCLLGLVIPDGGDIQLDGVSTLSGWEYRRHIGYMPQNPDFPSNLSIRELLNLLEDIRGEKAPLRDELIRLFGVASDLNRPFGVLSGGTKQKVATIAAFMFQPRVLILDEPTVGLDPISAIEFKNLTRKMANQGSAILLVSHIMSEMEQLADQLVFMLDGNVSFHGSAAELRARGGNSQNLEGAIVDLLRARK